jgi:4-hydroxyphenylpyruvate dioxygenase
MVRFQEEKLLTNVLGLEYVELYVSDVHQAVQFYRSLGFEIVDHPASMKELHDRVSFAVRSHNIQLILTTALVGSSAVAEHIRVHGDGVKDIALTVTGVDELFENAIRNGADIVASPSKQDCSRGSLRTACVGVFGDLVHTLIEQSDGLEAPPANSMTPSVSQQPNMGIEGIDHIALALNCNELDRWASFYIDAFGFLETHQELVSTEHSAMRSKVVQSKNGKVCFPMMEPSPGKRKSQIDHFIECHQGPGTQHLAFRSSNIIESVASFLALGLEFLTIPKSYYSDVEARVGQLPELGDLEKYGILADRDATGMLLQIFTKPIGSRPTLFLELVERRGAEGFGNGNIKALFKAVESGLVVEKGA